MEKPLYKIDINLEDIDETGIELISLVGRPAIGIKGVTFAEIDEEGCPVPPCHPNCMCDIVNGQWKLEAKGKSESGPCEYCQANKKRYNRNKNRPGGGRFSMFMDDEKMIVAAPTMIPDLVIDRSDEYGEYQVIFSKEVIEKIVQKFFRTASNHSINLEHTKSMVPGYILEHWIVEDTFKDKSNLYGFELPVGSHFMMVKIEDKQFWDKEVKGNNKTGFSIEGILGHKLVRMSEEDIINSLSLEEIMSLFAEPFKGETKSEFMSRCITTVLDDGSAESQEQAVAMCLNMWNK